MAEHAPAEIPEADWQTVLDGFSRSHRDCPVRIEQVQGAEHKVQVERAPLNGISSDHPGGRDALYISVGETPGQAITHEVASPRRLRLDAAAPDSAEIEAADGARTVIRCLEHRRAA